MEELTLLEQAVAVKSRREPVSLLINPDVDANTHPNISTGLKQNKFSIGVERALAVSTWAAASPHLDVIGVDGKIGSHLTKGAPFVDALEREAPTNCKIGDFLGEDRELNQ